jgi:hypothetical protein
MNRIADDEERHAELAWRMLAWAVRTNDEAKSMLATLLSSLDRDDAFVRDLVLPCASALV